MMTTAGNGKKTKSVAHSSTRRIPVTPIKNKPLLSANEFQSKVAQKAYELFEARGCFHGNDIQDWFEAERTIRESNSVKS